MLAISYYSFNPRAREGRDVQHSSSPSISPRFNPRAREGRDPNELHLAGGLHVSIHAPARGATSKLSTKLVTDTFQSTRPRGARHGQAFMQDLYLLSFNPRAREGRDKARGMRRCILTSFNPRAREGRDEHDC